LSPPLTRGDNPSDYSLRYKVKEANTVPLSPFKGLKGESEEDLDSIMVLPYREKDHGVFDEEWEPHRGATDWWYATGYLKDLTRPEHLYSYQFTVFNPRHFGKNFYDLNLALTDIQTGLHIFKNRIKLSGERVKIDRNSVSFHPYAWLQKNDQGMALMARLKGLEFSLNLDLGKGAFWHGDDGVIVMGAPEKPQQRAVYYSYTNMPTSGIIKTGAGSGQTRELEVTGKSWFDRQWGPFHLFNTNLYWEWFSLRFFDDEEVMLFTFPRQKWYEGTYIDKNGKSRRITDYRYTCQGFKQKGRSMFSNGWDIYLPGVKDERYRILPMNNDQYNGGYYELMAGISTMDGRAVGYGIVELLPGARVTGKKLNLLNHLFNPWMLKSLKTTSI
jgi:predicted secreted hydrolase